MKKHSHTNKKQIFEKLLLYGVLLFLLAGGIYTFASGKTFSDTERRSLSSLPDMESFTEWILGRKPERTDGQPVPSFDEQLETCISEHLPHRRLLVSMSRTAQALSGQGILLECWPVGDAVIEPPLSVDPPRSVSGQINDRLRFPRDFAKKAEKNCLFLIPPTAGSLLDETGIYASAYAEEREALAALYAGNGDVIPLDKVFRDSSERVLYKTDHHWTLHGAYLAYTALCEKAGLEPAPLSDFVITEYAPFYGTTLSRSGMLRYTADILRCAEPGYGVIFRFSDKEKKGWKETETDHLIFPENAGTYDGYSVFMNGTHNLYEIISSAPGAEGTLLVYGDSFSLSILPFLSANYKHIVMCDIRYPSPMDAYKKAPDADLILFIYSAEDLCNHTNIPKMKWR